MLKFGSLIVLSPLDSPKPSTPLSLCIFVFFVTCVYCSMSLFFIKVDQHISDLSSVIPTLKSHLNKVESATQDEESAVLENYRYQHLSHIAPESRLLAKQGLKLKVMITL